MKTRRGKDRKVRPTRGFLLRQGYGATGEIALREIDGTRVKIGPIEVFDGTSVVDIKSASTRADR